MAQDSPPPAESVPSPAALNRRAASFRALFGELPTEIQVLATKVFRLFITNPHHPSLRLHALKDNKKGQHWDETYSVSIGMRYRALFVRRTHPDRNVWYWIGTHAQYNHFTGKN